MPQPTKVTFINSKGVWVEELCHDIATCREHKEKVSRSQGLLQKPLSTFISSDEDDNGTVSTEDVMKQFDAQDSEPEVEKPLVLDGTILPYKFTKRIDKTTQGRTGGHIHKRRNRRDYRVIMQYKTWDKLERAKSDMLDSFSDGYAVIITPEEYFGSNYPERSPQLNPNFTLGSTGFLYYETNKEYETYKPFSSWHEVYELSTNGKVNPSWVGHYVLNIRNTSPQKISPICLENSASKKKIVADFFATNYPHLKTYPVQTGLGNYDYDYASKEMQEQVQVQMLLMLLASQTEDKKSFAGYIMRNASNPEIADEKSKKFIDAFDEETYEERFTTYVDGLTSYATAKGLFDEERLAELGVWNKKTKRPICPLCKDEIHAEQFTAEIPQEAGREVAGNTQREIVLMHVSALKPGELNHTTYNLGWGHAECNKIQGDDSIQNTISRMMTIVDKNRSFMQSQAD